jgi:hypothetical protein
MGRDWGAGVEGRGGSFVWEGPSMAVLGLCGGIVGDGTVEAIKREGAVEGAVFVGGLWSVC